MSDFFKNLAIYGGGVSVILGAIALFIYRIRNNKP